MSSRVRSGSVNERISLGGGWCGVDCRRSVFLLVISLPSRQCRVLPDTPRPYGWVEINLRRCKAGGAQLVALQRAFELEGVSGNLQKVYLVARQLFAAAVAKYAGGHYPWPLYGLCDRRACLFLGR